MKNETMDIFEKYSSYGLSDEELDWFENELKINKRFESDFQNYKEIHNVLSDRQLLAFAETIYSFQKNNKSIASKGRVILYSIISSAATILIIIGILQFIKTIDSNKEFDKELFSIKHSFSINKDTEANNLVEAIVEYNNKNFKQAIKLFELNRNEKTIDFQLTFYLAMSYFQINEFQVAENLFLFIINDGNNYFIDQAEWYLAVLYHKKGQDIKAVKLFQKIISKNNNQKQKAVNALEIIKNK